MVKNNCNNPNLTPTQRYYCKNVDDFDETIFKQSESDNGILGKLIILGAIVAGAYTVGSLIDNSQQMQIIKELMDAQSAAPDELKTSIIMTSAIYDKAQEIVSPEKPIDGNIINYLIQPDYTLSKEEITQYNNLLEDVKQLGRVSDPNTVENLAFRNAQMIQENIGTFGAIEAEKHGALVVWKSVQDAGFNIMIPWETMGDEKVCGDCALAEADGPYLPEDYPEPYHYKDRCMAGDPIIDYNKVTMP